MVKMTTALWTINTQGSRICTTYLAASFNEKDRSPVWAWRCLYTLKIRLLYFNVHTSEGAYQ
jgi:hypothetical protein